MKKVFSLTNKKSNLKWGSIFHIELGRDVQMIPTCVGCILGTDPGTAHRSAIWYQFSVEQLGICTKARKKWVYSLTQ